MFDLLQCLSRVFRDLTKERESNKPICFAVSLAEGRASARLGLAAASPSEVRLAVRFHLLRCTSEANWGPRSKEAQLDLELEIV